MLQFALTWISSRWVHQIKAHLIPNGKVTFRHFIRYGNTNIESAWPSNFFFSWPASWLSPWPVHGRARVSAHKSRSAFALHPDWAASTRQTRTLDLERRASKWSRRGLRRSFHRDDRIPAKAAIEGQIVLMDHSVQISFLCVYSLQFNVQDLKPPILKHDFIWRLYQSRKLSMTLYFA